MRFKDDWKGYKKTRDIETMFFSKNDITIKKLLLLEYGLDFSQEYTAEEGQFSLIGNNNYPSDVNHIYTISVEDHGLFTSSQHGYILDSIDDYNGYIDQHEKPIEAEFNDSALVSPVITRDNNKHEIVLEVQLIGEQRDLHLIEEWRYFVIAKVEVMNSETSYSNRLVLEGWDLYKENKWDLCLLVFYSAIDNLITLEAEKLQEKYYKEINLISLEFKNKVSLVIKEAASIAIDQQDFAAHSYIMKEISALYKLRNNVAHGSVRDITESDCANCFDLYLFILAIIEYGSTDTTKLLRDVKKMLA